MEAEAEAREAEADAVALAAARAEDAALITEEVARVAARAEARAADLASLESPARLAAQNAYDAKIAEVVATAAEMARVALVVCIGPPHDHPCIKCERGVRCDYLRHPDGEVCCCCLGETGTIEARCEGCSMFTCDNCHYPELGCMCPVCDRDELQATRECMHCMRVVRVGQYATGELCIFPNCWSRMINETYGPNTESCWDCTRSKFVHYSHMYTKSKYDSSDEDDEDSDEEDIIDHSCPLVHELENTDGWVGFWETRIAQSMAREKVNATKRMQVVKERAAKIDARYDAVRAKAWARSKAAWNRVAELCKVTVVARTAVREEVQELAAAAAAARTASREEAQAETDRAVAIDAAVLETAKQRIANTATKVEALLKFDSRVEDYTALKFKHTAALAAWKIPEVAARVVAAWATARAAPESKAKVAETWAALIVRLDAKDACPAPESKAEVVTPWAAYLAAVHAKDARLAFQKKGKTGGWARPLGIA